MNGNSLFVFNNAANYTPIPPPFALVPASSAPFRANHNM